MTLDTLLSSTDGSDATEAAAGPDFELTAPLDTTVDGRSAASARPTSATSGGDSPGVRERLRERADRRASVPAPTIRDERAAALAGPDRGVAE